MADIKRYGFMRHLRADAGVHVMRFRNGRPIRSGRGLAFWFVPHRASIAELPMDDRDMVLFFKGRSKDFQAVTVQGNLTWRVADPNVLGTRVDFSIDLKNGRHTAKPVEQIEALLTGMSQQLATHYFAQGAVHDLLNAGIEPLRVRLEQGLGGSERLAAMGIEIVAIRLAAIAPTAELERALQTPTFEGLQQKADQAIFERRALAVEKERARMAIYRDLSSHVLLGLAARELAGKLTKIDHLNVTPDLLATVLGEFGRSTRLPSGEAGRA
jgi:SPFH domain / Band 7 family